MTEICPKKSFISHKSIRKKNIAIIFYERQTCFKHYNMFSYSGTNTCGFEAESTKEK